MKDSHAYLRLTTGFLTVFCIALAVQAMACLVLFGHMATLLFEKGISADGGRFLLLLSVNTLCDAATFLLFTILTAKVRRGARPFGKWQTRMLVTTGILMSLKAIVSIMWPTFQLPYSEILGAAEFVFPEFDFQSLSYGLVFFALAGVFEYGRVLQEDSDEIL